MYRPEEIPSAIRSALAGLQGSGISPRWSPAADIYRTQSGWLVKVELAGVEQGDVELLCAGNRLTVRGRRRDTVLTEGGQQFSLEITYSSFERSIQIPCDLDKARLGIEFRSGMLLIRVDCEA